MAESTAPKMADQELLRMTADVVAAYVSNNTLPMAQMAEVINAVYGSLRGLETQVVEPPSEPLKPAVSPRRSITPDYLICLDDGRRFKSLRRHLATLGMSPEQYRVKWDLPKDYPIVAPNYASVRSALAKKLGLGQARKKS